MTVDRDTGWKHGMYQATTGSRWCDEGEVPRTVASATLNKSLMSAICGDRQIKVTSKAVVGHWSTSVRQHHLSGHAALQHHITGRVNLQHHIMDRVALQHHLMVVLIFSTISRVVLLFSTTSWVVFFFDL